MMSIIPVRSPLHSEITGLASETLLSSCLYGFREMLQTGQGSFMLRVFGLVLMIAAFAFLYTAGKWMLIFAAKTRSTENGAVAGSASRLAEIAASCLPYIRVPAVICVLLVIVFALRNFFSIASPIPKVYLLWLDILIAIAICCTVRSFFLFYDYQHGGDVDLDEATWFWGVSGFLLAGATVFGIMDTILVKTPVYEGMADVISESLLMSCYHGLRDLIGSWQGSLALRAFWLTVILATVAFVYTVGKWILVFLPRFRGE
jgi:hypothetical protein